MTIIQTIRRLIVWLSITALLFGAFSVMAVALPADMDGDGITDTSDVRVLLLSLVGGEPLTEEQRQQADLDGDGVFGSTDIRLLLTDLIHGTTTTQPTTVTSTRPITTYATTNTTNTTDTTYPPTTTTTWVLTGPDGTAPTTYPTTTNTTFPDCVSTNTTVPTTMPYGSFTISVGNVSAHGGDTITVPVKITSCHALVGFEMNIRPHYGLRLKAVNEDARNPYATNLNPAVFNDDAQWRFTKDNSNVLNIRYVSAATEGSLDSGTLFYLTFEVIHVIRDTDFTIGCDLLSYVCCANRTDYMPPVDVVSGMVSVTPGTTLYPTTTTTWCGFTTTTTLPYGDPLCFTGETQTVRVGNTFDWTIDVSQHHSLVGLELDICYDPSVLTWIPEGTAVNDVIFDGHAQWRITQTALGTLTLRYVSAANTGDAAGGNLLSLQFLLRDDTLADDTWIYLMPISSLSAVNGYTYHATEGTVADGYIQVASRSTRPPTRTTTTDTTTTDTTYPPTTTTFVYAG